MRSTACVETLEDRLFLAFTPTPITRYHVDAQSNGVNSTETLLTPSTVNVNQFGKQFSTTVDGQVYAEPLYVPNVNITSGTQQGAHNVVYVATEHDSLYAIDAHGGNVLWKRSFQSIEDPSIANGTVSLVNPLGATAIIPMPSSNSGSGDLTPEIGITATPVIDLPNKVIYLVAKSKETIGGNSDHYVQILYKVSIQSGAVLGSTVIGDTRNNGSYTYVTTGAAANTPYAIGTGDGAITVNGQSRVYFNAQREFGRVGLQLYNGTIYMGFASHGDNGPYHGWMLAYDASTLAIKGALNTTPNGGLGGIWQGGGTIGIDPQGYFYFETGNGSFNTSASNFGTNYSGLPKDGNYGDSFLKVALDPTTSPANQNKNGWGLKVVDFFSPFNNADLNSRDTDLGSSGLTILPDAVGSTAHPHLLVGSGKEGKLYLIDRDNMGGFNPSTDRVVQEQGSALSGLLNTPAFFFNNPTAPTPSGTLLTVMGYGGGARAFGVSNGTFTTTPTSQTTNDFGYLPGSPTISADGTTNGILWAVNRNNNKLYAYRADNLGVELWDSGQAAGNRDQLGSAIKFSVPTVADGQVFVGTANALVVYGPPVPPTSPPAAPTGLTATATRYNQIVLNWQDVASNEDMFRIERTTTPGNPASWQEIGTTSANATTYTDDTVLSQTTYSYRIRSFNSYLGGSYSAYTAVATATTPQAPPMGIGDGAYGQYYIDANGQHLAGSPAMTRIDPQINFDWGTGSPGGPIGTDNFSVRWTGRIQAQVSETYTFYTESDDGVRFMIKPAGAPTFTTLVDNFTDHSATENSGTYAMSGGQFYDFEMDFYEKGGDALAQLLWSSPSTDKGPIPQSQLYSGVAPAAPTNLTAVAASGTQVNLTWQDHSTIETGYVVERKDPGGSYKAIATLPPSTTSYMDASLNPDTVYSYRVVATNFASNSPYSNEVTLTTPIPPAKPTNAHPTSVTTTSIAMAWNDVANNEDGYRISRAAAGDDNFLVIAQLPPNTVSYTDNGPNGNGLAPGTEYEYHIQAFNVAGYNDFSGFRTATLTLAPTSLAASGGNGQITLNWTPPTFHGSATSMSYSVYRSTTPGAANPTRIATDLTDPTFTDTSLPSGTTYYYTVTAVDAGGESAHSAEASASTQAAIPPRVASVLVSSTQWTAGFLSYLNSAGLGSGGFAIPAGASQASPLPWTNIDQVKVWFSQDVTVHSTDLQLRGVNVPSYAISNFAYDATTFTATWTLGTPIAADKLLVDLSPGITASSGGAALDGEWSNGTSSFPSGNGTAGGRFDFTFNVLPGDVNRSGSVLGNDLILVRNAQFQSPTDSGYSALLDVNGSGSIFGNDVILVRNLQFTSLPAGTPTPPAASQPLFSVAAISGGSKAKAFHPKKRHPISHRVRV